MKDLKGKRLLVLGGSLWKNAIKAYTDSQGIRVIAAGNNTDAGIFDIADEKYCINSVKADEMKAFIADKDIDGVYLGGSEVVIGSACKYLAEIHKPCYCVEKQWNLVQNKKQFKQVCIEAGLPTVPEYSVNPQNPVLPEECFPVITKPTDGCGSAGFSVCRDNRELKKGYDIAAENSLTGTVIIEKFVKNDANVVFYTVNEGKIYFSGLSDKYPVCHKKQGSYVGGLFVYESASTEVFREQFEDSIQKMITNIGIKQGSFWIEVFHNADDYYFNEFGYRYGGSASLYPTEYFYGINQVATDIYYALTGEGAICREASLFPELQEKKAHYAIYPVHIGPGRIKNIEGLSAIQDDANILKVLTTKSEGDLIEDTGSFAQAYALIHIMFNQTEELIKTLDRIHKQLKITDEAGENMILRLLDPEKISVYS